MAASRRSARDSPSRRRPRPAPRASWRRSGTTRRRSSSAAIAASDEVISEARSAAKRALTSPERVGHTTRIVQFQREAVLMLLEGKVAIVPGAGRGIGREEALLMAKLGAKVVVNDLGAHFDGTGAPTATPAQDVVSEIKKNGGDAIANGDNVADYKAAKNIVDTAIKTFGKLNIVVNNAGILGDRMIFNMDEESWDAVVAVHLKGTFNMARHACEYWREEHKKGNQLNGRIINTASDAGLIGNVGQSNYGACKAAVAAMAIII